MPRSRGSDLQARLQKLLLTRRTAAGLSQRDLAKLLRQPQSFVSKFENGERRLDVVELIEVCQALGVEPATFLRELMEPPL